MVPARSVTHRSHVRAGDGGDHTEGPSNRSHVAISSTDLRVSFVTWRTG